MVKGRHRRGKTARWLRRRLHGAGALLLAVSAGIHLDLYLTGYRSIPTIGWLFLLQVIVAFALTAAVLVTHSWVAAAASAGFALSTLGAYLLAVWVGLFGFKEIRTRAGIAAGLIEVAAFGVLALAAITVGAALQADGPVSPGARMRGRVQAAVAMVIGAVGLVSVSRPGPARRRRSQRGQLTCGYWPRSGYLEDRDDRRCHRAHQREGPDAVLVRS